MSFYGKKFKRSRMENVLELIEQLSDEGKIFEEMTRKSDSVTTFNKNDDGSTQYVLSKNDQEAFSFKMESGKLVEVNVPGGLLIKALSEIEGDEIKTTITFPSGKILHINRYLGDDDVRTVFSIEGNDLKGVIYYDTV